jgi:hypothetical protein
MSITKNPPNTIVLSGPVVEVGDLAASEAITPGMLIAQFNNGGIVRFHKHATAGGAGNTVAMEQSMLNKTIDDAYAANDLVQAAIGAPGAAFYMIIASGANIAAGDLLESAGNGKLRALSSGVAIYKALENKDNSAGPGDARIRAEVV